METWKKITIGAVAGVLLIAGGVFGVSWWSHRGALNALNEPNPSPEQIVKIVDLLESEDGRILGQVDKKLQDLGEQAVPALEAKARKAGDDPRIRAYAVKVMMGIDQDKGMTLINEMLDPVATPDVVVRRDLIVLLDPEMAKTEAGKAIVEKAANDPDSQVQASATELLPPDSMDTLRRLTESADPYTRRHAERQIRTYQNQRRR